MLQNRCQLTKTQPVLSQNSSWLGGNDVIGWWDDVIGWLADVIGWLADVIGWWDDVIGWWDDVIGWWDDVIGWLARVLSPATSIISFLAPPLSKSHMVVST